jgi:hypothetical protein
MEIYQKTVESQFQKTWKGPACPEVKAIYKIIVAEASLKQYKQYLYGLFLVLADPACRY